MNAVFRLEIMADSGELHKLTAILNRSKVVTYTIIRNVVSHGVCGETEDVGFALENDFIIAFCPPDRIEQLIDEIRPVLNKFGGVCYVSEVQEVDTIGCIVRR